MKFLPKWLLCCCWMMTLLFVHRVTVHAQLNMTFLGQKTYTPELSDVWGYVAPDGTEYALVTLDNGISIVDVTDPTNLIEKALITQSGSSTFWREARVWGEYAYVTNEAGQGLLIIDLTNIASGSAPSSYWTGGPWNGSTLNWSTAHNIFIDENGIGYIVGANYGVGGAIMIDIAANATNPTIVGVYDGAYVHDCFVRNNVMWAAQINNGNFVAVDVTDKANPSTISTAVNSPDNLAHNCWLSDDGVNLFVTDETSGAPVTSYDVTVLNDIKKLYEYRSNPGSGVIPHNTFVLDNFIVTSYYRDGVTVADMTHPKLMIEVGNYDTSPLSGNGYNGAWGVYPYLPSGKILVSDIENGLFVLSFNGTKAAYIEGTVTDVAGSPIPGATVNISGVGTATTDFSGHYLLGTVTAGNYSADYEASQRPEKSE